MGPVGPLPGRRWNVSAAIRTLPAAVRQLLFLDREDRAFRHLDVPHDAIAAGLIAEFDVVASGLDASNSQALVVVNRSIPIFLHWSGPQLSFPAGDIWSVVIVYKVRFQNRIPLRSWAAAEEATRFAPPATYALVA